MVKFEAKKIDLELELTTLKGEKVPVMSPKVEMNAEEIVNCMDVWKSIEKEHKGNNIKIVAEQLAIVYPKKTDWFLQNFDAATLSEIVVHIAQAMAGVRKNDESSN